MKIKKMLSYILLFSFILGINNINIVNASDNEESSPLVQYESEYNVSYYSDIKGLKGDNLLEGLANLSLTNHKYYTSYSDLKGGLAYSDEDPNNSSKIIDFYTGWSINNEWSPSASSDYINPWNREHVWCKSLSNSTFVESGAGSDIHHIRPENTRINSARNNGLFKDLDESYRYYYTNETTGEVLDTGCYRDGDTFFEPREESKGDVARILMYLYMHYSTEVSYNANNNPNNFSGNLVITSIVSTSENTNQAAWDLLLSWNKLDPVDTFEQNRNNYCASVTGVRNPFIDHEEFASIIWDSTYNGDGALNDTDTPSDEEDDPVTPDTPSDPTLDTNESKTYTFSEYTSGTQYAQNEEHTLDDNTIVTTTQCHFTSELRIYASSSHDGNAIIKSNKNINKITLNIGYNIDTLNVFNEYNSLIGSITTTSSSYLDYSLNISPSSNYLKLDVSGTNQLRIKSMTLYFDIDIVEDDKNSNIIDEIKKIETKVQLDFSYTYEKNNSDVQAKSIVEEDISVKDSSENHASNVNLDSSIFNVSFIKGDPTYPLIKSDGTIRLYANRTSGNGSTLIIELKDKTSCINDISFNATNSEVLTIKDSNGSIINSNNGNYEINDYKFLIQNTHYDSSASKNINSFISLININYGEPAVYSNFSSINLRYSANISNDYFEEIESYGINIKVDDISKDYEITKTTDYETSKEFALVLKNIDDYTAEITATAYVYINNERIELISKTYSVTSMIDYYINNSSSLNLTTSQIEALNAFKETL